MAKYNILKDNDEFLKKKVEKMLSTHIIDFLRFCITLSMRYLQQTTTLSLKNTLEIGDNPITMDSMMGYGIQKGMNKRSHLGSSNCMELLINILQKKVE